MTKGRSLAYLPSNIEKNFRNDNNIIVSCLEDEENLCERVEQCATLEVYKRIDEAVNGVVDNITLQDLVDWHIQKGNNYVI